MSLDRLRRLRTGLVVGDVPDDVSEWLLAGVERTLLDRIIMDEALELPTLTDPRADPALRRVRDEEIREIAGGLEGTQRERSAELLELIRRYAIAPDPRLDRLMGLGVQLPRDARQLRRIVAGTYW